MKKLHILDLPENTNLLDIPYKLHNFNMSQIDNSIHHFNFLVLLKIFVTPDTDKQVLLSRIKTLQKALSPKKYKS